MSLLGEEVVEEWLNRNGYFTIRGIKVGVDEIDILAIRPLPRRQVRVPAYRGPSLDQPDLLHHKGARGHPEADRHRRSQREEERCGAADARRS